MPRCLFFVNEGENPAIIQAGQTVTVNPRRGTQDKKPWRSLDLAAITGQTIERQHVYDVHLGETVVPYTQPSSHSRQSLPLKEWRCEMPADSNGVGRNPSRRTRNDGCATAGRLSAAVGGE